MDDEKDVALTLKIALENQGFEAVYFTDPEVALKNFEPGMYDLTIIDIRMPKMNGFELYSKIKSNDAKVKTLFLTALSSLENYNTQKNKVYPKLKERHFAKKPISNNDLLEHVYSILN